MKRVLILEPYYGGSHKHFLDGLQSHVSAAYTLFALPARKWKMRMQLSAPWFVDKILELPEHERYFDTVLCSTFVDVAVFRALITQVDGWNSDSSIVTYFHENQFAYPEQQGRQNNIFAFTAINFTTALTSDKIAFNSSFNKDTFMRGCQKYLKNASDMIFPDTIKNLEQKSRVLFPGIDFSEIDRNDIKSPVNIPIIVWNHRWEHDKNPELFFKAIYEIKRRDIDFHLIILGQSFRNSPECFSEARERLRDKIIHYGFADSYKDYVKLLCMGDVIVSTSLHEFYGISIIEGVRAGCEPILPDRLSYPELFPDEYLYRGDTLVERLQKILLEKDRMSAITARELTDKFSWQCLKASYEEWLWDG